MTPDRPIDRFVKRSQHILQKEYVVIGTRRVSSFTAWAVIAFFIGIAIAVAFLASRSGALEGSEAARAPRPVWSSWGNWKEGSAPSNAPTVQYRSRTKTSAQIVNGTKTRVRVQGYEERQCQKNCESLGAPLAASSGGTGSLYVTVKKDGLEVDKNDCLINPLNGSFTGPSGTTSFTCLPHYYASVPAGNYTFAYTSGGPAGFTFQPPVECDPLDCNVPAGGTLNAYYKFTSSGGVTTYQASAGFSSTQGANGWSYIDGATSQFIPASGYHEAGTFSECDSDPCWRGSESYMIVKSAIQHPGTNNPSVRRWIAPQAGSAHIITGPIKHVGGACSDGVDVQVGSSSGGLPSSWTNPHHLPPGGQDSLNTTLSVNKADAISFIVLKGPAGANNSCDWTQFDPRIEFTPTETLNVEQSFSVSSPWPMLSLDGANSQTTGLEEVSWQNVTVGTHTLTRRQVSI